MKRPSRRVLELSATYFGLAGLIAVIVAAAGAWAAVTAVSSGCQVLIGDVEVVAPAAANGVPCVQRVAVAQILLGAILGGVLLATSVWLAGRRGGVLSRIIPVGAAIGLLVGVVPLVALRSLVDAGYLSLGALEVGAAVLPLAWGVLSAVVAFAAWRERQRPASG